MVGCDVRVQERLGVEDICTGLARVVATDSVQGGGRIGVDVVHVAGQVGLVGVGSGAKMAGAGRVREEVAWLSEVDPAVETLNIYICRPLTIHASRGRNA